MEMVGICRYKIMIDTALFCLSHGLARFSVKLFPFVRTLPISLTRKLSHFLLFDVKVSQVSSPVVCVLL